jgi:ribokinase
VSGDPEVFVVGSVNADLVVEVPRRPGPGETVSGTDLATLPGGKGANQAVAAARLGGRVAMLGRVGRDSAGEVVAAALSHAGVDTADIEALAGVPTGVALITLTPDGENSIVVSPGANGRLAPGDVDAVRERLARAAVLTLQLEIPMETVVRAVAVGAEVGSRIVLNLAPPRRPPDAVLRKLDPLVVNEHEAAALLGAVSPGSGEEVARRLCDLGPRSAVVTLGAAGAAFAGSGASGVARAPRVSVVDTTGAGDAFVGALSLALARGHDLQAACRYGVGAGSWAVQGKGAQTSFPDADQLEIPEVR